MKYERFFILVSIILILFFLFIQYTIFNDLKEQTVSNIIYNQKVLSEEVSVGISEYIDNVTKNLNSLSTSPDIINVTSQGKFLLKNYLKNFNNDIKGVTRVNAAGKIIYTFPDTGSIGKDISDQEHIKFSLINHKTVISDVFKAVQGYKTVAIHVPVFRNDKYDGTLAFLLSFDEIAKRYVKNIKLGKSGHARIISEKGIEIASPDNFTIDKSVREIYKSNKELLYVIEKVLNQKEGFAKVENSLFNHNSKKNSIAFIYYEPIKFVNTFWSVLIISSEEEMLSSLNSFKLRLVLITIVLFSIFIASIYLTFKLKFSVAEHKKRELVLNALKESESRYKTLFNQNPLATFIYDTETLDVLAVNEVFLKQYKLDKFEPKKLSLLDIIDESERNKLAEFHRSDAGKIIGKEWKYKRKDGQIFEVETFSDNITYHRKPARIVVASDITERKRSLNLIKENLIKFKTLFENSPDAIFITHPFTLEIIECNEKACVMNGYSRDELIGNSIEILHTSKTERTEEDFEERKKFIEQLRINKTITIESVHKRKDGTIFPIETSLCLLTLDENIFVLGIDRDITARKNAEDELKRYHENLETMVKERTFELEKEKEKAESADRLKSSFLATMSHELRTPLNSIIGFTGILLKQIAGPLNEEQTKQLGMVKNSSIHLLELINDVLDISKIEADRMEIKIKEVDVIDSLNKVLSTLKPLSDKKELKLEFITDLTNLKILSDQKRFEQIVVNLISNAIKFTNKGGIRVILERTEKNCVIKVIDTGIGIKQTDFDKLFKPFSQIDTGITRSHEGTGLGLSISQKLALKMGGSVSVESEFGVGSTFTLTLPL